MSVRTRFDVSLARQTFEQKILPKLLAEANPANRKAAECRLKELFHEMMLQQRITVLLENELFGEKK